MVTGRGHGWHRIVIYSLLLLAALYFLLPLLVMLITSVKSLEEIRQGTLLSLPQAATFDHARVVPGWG